MNFPAASNASRDISPHHIAYASATLDKGPGPRTRLPPEHPLPLVGFGMYLGMYVLVWLRLEIEETTNLKSDKRERSLLKGID